MFHRHHHQIILQGGGIFQQRHVIQQLQLLQRHHVRQRQLQLQDGHGTRLLNLIIILQLLPILQAVVVGSLVIDMVTLISVVDLQSHVQQHVTQQRNQLEHSIVYFLDFKMLYQVKLVALYNQLWVVEEEVEVPVALDPFSILDQNKKVVAVLDFLAKIPMQIQIQIWTRISIHDPVQHIQQAELLTRAMQKHPLTPHPHNTAGNYHNY